MISRLGYACIALGIDATTNRTCRLANATPERLRTLIRANLEGLARVLRYNAQRDIRFFRISSLIVPFASHPVNTLLWWEEFRDTLADLGRYARSEGMRLTMHPGHHTVLSSPRANVVDAAIADLLYHARFLDSLGTGTNGKIVIHVGGTYGDRLAAIDRFAATYVGLPAAVKARLVLENDERSYAAADVLLISQRTGIPVVFDALHDLILPSPGFPDRSALLQACFATWQTVDGQPIVHFSTQDTAKQPGAHAEWIDTDAFLRFDRDTGLTTVDCMLEAKGKELALVRLRDEVAARRTQAA